MKDLDYGAGYQYAHNTEEKITDMECFPESMKGRRYYFPTTQGSEEKVRDRLEKILEWKRNRKQ